MGAIIVALPTIIEGEIIEPSTRGELLAVRAWGDIKNGDVLQLMLKDKRSPETRRAYEGDLRHFHLATGALYGARAAAPLALREFISDIGDFIEWPPPKIAERLAIYKNGMIEIGLKEATINRRLSAVRALLKRAFRLGRSQTDGRGLVDNEKVFKYLNTRGYKPEIVKRLLKLPAEVHGEGTRRALRDAAIMRLMVELGLRRIEVTRVDVGDFSLANRELRVLGKARGTQKQVMDLPPRCADAIAAYLLEAGHARCKNAPLFCNLDHRLKNDEGDDMSKRRLSGKGVEYIVMSYEKAAGVERLRPHDLRHTSITQASLKLNGNAPLLMRFSRHADANTVMGYIRNAENAQGKVSAMLSDLFD